MVKRIFKIALKSLLVIVLLIGIYVIAAFLLPHIKVNTDFSSKKEGIKIFVVSNGVHTDLVLPSRTNYKNWCSVFPKQNFDVTDSAFAYTAFGWGDKGFYLETPTWNDLKFSTAFKAAFGLSKTAMHVRYLKQPKVKGGKCVEIIIDETGYKKLVTYIEESFAKEANSFIKIDHPGYGNFDRFYEANGTYSAFKTCNIWTLNGLKNIGVKVAWWSPFSKGLMNSLKP